jgi:ATP-dependent RNA circularization protein (DNA/RNA ligase family)
MKEYHKIQTLYKRDDKGRIIEGEWTQPELEYLCVLFWEWTEKVDGTNIRVYWDGKEVHFAGRTDRAQIPPLLLEHLANTFKPEDFLEAFGDEGEVTLYGEGYGNKIQKVGCKYLPDSVGFILFDVRIGHWWLTRENVEGIATTFTIPVVPIVGHGTLDDAIAFVKSEPSSLLGDCTMEGLVLRPIVELCNRGGHRIITKIKVKDFR